jgi:hypothetical protein
MSEIMEKKLYITPLVEAMLMEAIGAIMKTSIELGPDPAPERREPKF